MAKPFPVFCEECDDTGWIQPTPFLEDVIPCPHCDTGATKEKK